jgi:hypothetical protein
MCASLHILHPLVLAIVTLVTQYANTFVSTELSERMYEIMALHTCTAN